jgi:hypothetical protein
MDRKPNGYIWTHISIIDISVNKKSINRLINNKIQKLMHKLTNKKHQEQMNNRRNKHINKEIRGSFSKFITQYTYTILE